MRSTAETGWSLYVIMVFVAFFTGCASARLQPEFDELSAGKEGFWATRTCSGCHNQITVEHMESPHERSFTNPVFQAQYRQDLLPKADADPDLYVEAQECISCHEPIVFATEGPKVITLNEINPEMNGVTCDVCHTITGYRTPEPRNGNYIIVPSETKLGPFQSQNNWHHAYGELQTRSEICAICHEAVNHHGFQIKATYTEWRESDYSRRGIQCQDCHMNTDGFLTAGEPKFSSGKAARMTIGSAPERDRLYTHKFPGAHSKTQIEGAITLAIALKPIDPEGNLQVEITVDNTRTGHSMPSGSADLRLLWLEVSAVSEEQQLILPAEAYSPEATDEMSAYSVAGLGMFDARILGAEVPKGSRVYRAIFADGNGRATLDSYDAVEKLFDNRLKAGEKRRDSYRLVVPREREGDLRIEATLKYLPYSSAFTNRFGLPKPEAVIVAQEKMLLPTSLQ
ncbi:MAG: multiheme c-type cytochrome [Acidobacteriota bacterium]